MDIFWIRVTSQLGVYAVFLLYFLWATRQGRREWVPLLSAAVYAVLFEHLNMQRYANVPGGYHYHPNSWLALWGDVPLYIPLAWGFILMTSRRLTDRLALRSWARPCCDALLALLIDLSLDAVAIRLGFWTWRGIGLNDAFFGVPADNFLGWLLVSYTFSALTRLLWEQPSTPESRAPRTAETFKTLTQLVLVPPVAYLLYLGMEAVVHLFYALFRAETQREQLVIVAATALLFFVVVLVGRRPRTEAVPKPTLLEEGATHLPRHVFHAFGIIGLFWVPAAERSPWLWGLAGSVWAVEAFVARRATLERRDPMQTDREG